MGMLMQVEIKHFELLLHDQIDNGKQIALRVKVYQMCTKWAEDD